MSLQDAIRSDVDQWPGLQEELSRAVCGSSQGLRHKLVGYKGSKFSPDELVMLQLATGGRHFVTELARELGGVFIQLPPTSEEMDPADLASECQAVTQRLAEMFGAINDALRGDGEIDSEEREQIEAREFALREQVKRYLMLSYRLYAPREK